MGSLRTDYIEACRDELAIHGVTYSWVEHGGKHLRLFFDHDGETKCKILPRTPSDSLFGIRKARADIRRILGIESEAGSHEPPRSKRRGRKAPKRPEPPSAITTKPDPWAALRDHPHIESD